MARTFTQNDLPKLRDNYGRGDMPSAREMNVIAKLLNNAQAHDGIWMKLGPDGLHIGGGGGGGTSFPWRLVSFGYHLAYAADTHVTTCRINPGTIRRAGLPDIAYTGTDEERTIVLDGQPEIVYLEVARSDNSITLKSTSVDPGNLHGVISIPLYRFDATVVDPGGEADPYLRYDLGWIYRIGEVLLDTPTR